MLGISSADEQLLAWLLKEFSAMETDIQTERQQVYQSVSQSLFTANTLLVSS
jgi:hypothetical protein